MILTEKHEMMRKFFRQFAETEFTPELLDELDETGEFNWEIFNKIFRVQIYFWMNLRLSWITLRKLTGSLSSCIAFYMERKSFLMRRN